MASDPVHLIPDRDASKPVRTRKVGDQHFYCLEPFWWAWLDLNQRPHPYQVSRAKRCADRPFPRSRTSVGGAGMRSNRTPGSGHNAMPWPRQSYATNASPARRWGGRVSAAGSLAALPHTPFASLRRYSARCAAGGSPNCCSHDAGVGGQSRRAEGGAMPRLDDTAVEEGLQRLPGWERRGNQIVKSFVREDFAQAMVFVNEVATAAEAAGHHPDIDIRWNKVTLALSSHAEGGLTDRDFQLAARIQELDQPTQPA